MDESQRKEIKDMINEIIIRKGKILGDNGFASPEENEQWTVEFLKVVGGPVQEERYVVKVNVPPFNGGMFLKRPLAFKIDETSGEIVEMTFDEWRSI